MNAPEPIPAPTPDWLREATEYRRIEDWTRAELTAAVWSLLTVNAAAMEIVHYVQDHPKWDDEELMRLITVLAGTYYLSPPLPDNQA